MGPSWFESTRDQLPPTRLMRDAIALALDGEVSDDGSLAEAAYRAALVPLSSVLGGQLARLRTLAKAGLVAAPERNEIIRLLLVALEIEPVSTMSIPNDDSWPGIVFTGCLPTVGAAEDRWLTQILQRGGVVVSSDRTAELPILSSGLNVGARQGGRRARMVLRPDLADHLVGEPDQCQLVADLHPPVWLPAGHPYLDRNQDCDVRVFARDANSDAPLVVLARIGGGHVLHAVAHWWQARQPDTTAVGLRPLASVPAFRELGTRFEGAQLGGFAAATVMLTCLLSGLAVALHRTGASVADTERGHFERRHLTWGKNEPIT